MKNVLIISSSLRTNSNSEKLANEFYKGAKESDNNVEFISLKDKNIKFCIGCLSCQKTNKCIIEDDVKTILEKVKNADVLVFATPIYYYGISGQLKTLLDRLNPLYSLNYKFKDVYLLATAAENEEDTFNKAIDCLQGWVDCFNNVSIKGVIKAGGVNSPNEILKEIKYPRNAYEFGKNIH